MPALLCRTPSSCNGKPCWECKRRETRNGTLSPSPRNVEHELAVDDCLMLHNPWKR